MKQLLLFAIFATIFLTGCSTFSDGTSVWADGLWLVAWLPGVGSLICFAVAYYVGKSGSIGTGLHNKGQDLPGVGMVNTGWFKWGVALAIITVLIIIGVNASR